jgi:quercetin dioxygenase-like cupin family protein
MTKPADFEARLRREGYGEVVTAEMKPGERRAEHAHDYEVEALVLDGEITLACDGEERSYRAGDIFRMAAGRPHEERVGEKGVRYLVGRRRI